MWHCLLMLQCQLVAQSSFNYSALLTMVGTLAGVGIGAYVTWRNLKAQLKHQDETHFHDKRLEVYAKFTAANTIVMVSLLGSQGAPDLKALTAFHDNFEILRLVASTPVLLQAKEVHSLVLQMLKANVGQRAELDTPLTKSTGLLLLAMRKELGISEE